MKKLTYYLVISILFGFGNTTYSQDWAWSNTILAENNNVSVTESVVDSENNIIVLGEFDGSIKNITNPILEEISLGASDLFIAKYNSSGNPIWMRFIHSTGDQFAHHIDVDSDDNIYIMGSFLKETCYFSDPNIIDTVLNTGSYDIHMAKYSANGDLFWAKNVGWGIKLNLGNTFYIDIDVERIIYAGRFKVENKFAEGSAGQTILPLSLSGGFISQMDLNGNYISHTHLEIPNPTGNVHISSITKYNNEYYCVGNFIDQVQLQSSLLNSEGASDLFIYKFDALYNELASQTVHGLGNDYSTRIDVNENGVYFSAMSQSNTITIEGSSPSIHNLSGIQDILLLKYDFNLEPTANAIYSNMGRAFVLNHSVTSDRYVISGEFNDSLILGIDTLISTTPGSRDAYWLVSDEDLNPIYAGSMTGSATDRVNSATFITDNEIVFTGIYKSDPFILTSAYGNQDTLNVATAGFSDGFVTKYTLCGEYDLRLFIDSTSCITSNDGKAALIVFKDEAFDADTINYDWQYLWSNSETTDTIENLSNGWAYVTLSNRYGCTYNDSVLISHDALLTTLLTDEVTLNCATDLYPTDTVFGFLGQRPYTYAWSSGLGTDSVITDVPVGTHYVSVTDDCGTLVVDSIVVGHIPTLISGISTHNTIIACVNGDDGEAWMNTSEGFGTIVYEWENSTSTDYIASDLAIGLHHVTVNDACISIEDSVNVVNLPSMNANISSSTPVSCDGNLDGIAETFVVGGVQPYFYVWSSGETTANAINLPEGMAYVTVSDACGTIIDSVNITVEPSMQLQLSANHELCSGGNGSVTVTATNGSGTHNYAWDITYPISTTPISTNEMVNDLTAARYYVEVTDACGTKVDSIDLTTNAILEATLSSHTEILSCDTSSNGSASVIASNGVLPYTFMWSSSASTSALANDLGTGTEYVTITDQCGTEIIDSIIVGYYPQLIAFAQFMTNANCINTNDGKASVIATGGVQPYTFNWSNSASTGTVADDLPVGMQYVTVSDYCGLTFDSVEIGSIPTLTFELTSSALQCPGDSLGIITANTNFGILPYTYDWGTSSNDNTPMVDSLWAGMHYVTVTDLCNAPIVDSIEIETTPTLNAYLTDHFVTVTCPSSSNGFNEIIVSGGLTPYNYSWSSGATTKIVDNLNVGIHYATITDQCAIAIVDSVYVSHLPAMDINIIANDPLCHNDTNGTIEIEVTQGIHPVTLVWEDFTNSDYEQTELKAGTYAFTVTDQCISIVDSISLDNPETISIAGNITDESSSVSMDGAIQTVVNGGTSPYQFLWNNNEVSQDLIDIPAGIYILAVTDYNDCSASQTFEIETKAVRIEPMEAFTPNSDGVNDVWDITNISEFPNADIKIFNQWGNLVYETKGYDEPWDGTNKGSELSAAVYYYIIDLKDGLEAQTGSITLIR